MTAPWLWFQATKVYAWLTVTVNLFWRGLEAPHDYERRSRLLLLPSEILRCRLLRLPLDKLEIVRHAIRSSSKKMVLCALAGLLIWIEIELCILYSSCPTCLCYRQRECQCQWCNWPFFAVIEARRFEFCRCLAWYHHDDLKKRTLINLFEGLGELYRVQLTYLSIVSSYLWLLLVKHYGSWKTRCEPEAQFIYLHSSFFFAMDKNGFSSENVYSSSKKKTWKDWLNREFFNCRRFSHQPQSRGHRDWKRPGIPFKFGWEYLRLGWDINFEFQARVTIYVLNVSI